MTVRNGSRQNHQFNDSRFNDSTIQRTTIHPFGGDPVSKELGALRPFEEPSSAAVARLAAPVDPRPAAASQADRRSIREASVTKNLWRHSRSRSGSGVGVVC